MNTDQFLLSNLYPISLSALSKCITDPRVAAKILKSYLVIKERQGTLDEELGHQLRTDILYLHGFGHDDFSVATSRSISIGVSELFLIKNNSKTYGYNELLFDFNTHTYIKTGLSPKLPVGDGVRSGSVIKTQYYEDRLRVSSFYETDYYNSKLNVIANSYNKNKSVHLHYFFDTGRATYIRDNCVQYLYPYSIDYNLHSTFLKEITTLNKKLNYNELSQKSFNSLMKYLRNPLWHDLDYPSLDYIDPKVYQRLKYHHTRYGTKALRAQFYSTPYRSLQNILRTAPYQVVKTYSDLVRNKVLVGVPIDTQAALCTAIKGINHSYTSRSLVDAIQNLLSFGFSLNKLISRLEKDGRFAPDIGNYPLDLYSDAGVNLNDSLPQVHDKLSIHFQKIKDKAYYGRVIELTEEEEKYHLEKDGYTFRPAAITDDLCTLGGSLQICVRSYAHSALSKDLTIVGVYKEGVPFACIEVRRNSIVQAKLYRNACVSSNTEFQDLVIHWASLNKLDISTRDISKNTDDQLAPRQGGIIEDPLPF